MKKVYEYLFPKKTKWIDVGCYERLGHYYLLQMRITIRSNKKTFRVGKMGMINDYTVKQEIYKSVLYSHN